MVSDPFGEVGALSCAFALLFFLFLSSCSGVKTRLDCVDECRARHMEYASMYKTAASVDAAGNIETKDTCLCK